ncbi:hypothetical protein BZM27_37480 [Paraburkholderia steynii]|uniref:Sel1 repeat family protein n=1 Tax=Paraburkholderia steynii TaxID=1245441 RepID=A0A4R0XB90_9BURK|nr:hypothetical protein BZM27_37480 [Paraburkholderia steynii]
MAAGFALIAFTSGLVTSPQAKADTPFSPKGLYETARSYEQSDPATAVRMYNDSSSAGYLPAQLLLAGMHRSGIAGVEKNCKKAIYWYELAEEQGSLEASSDRASIYADETGECYSPKADASLYRDAAEKGFPEAQHSLAILCMQGRGVPKDNLRAYAWFSTAMNSGNGRYRASLGLRDALAGAMTATQIEEARALSRLYILKYRKN